MASRNRRWTERDSMKSQARLAPKMQRPRDDDVDRWRRLLENAPEVGGGRKSEYSAGRDDRAPEPRVVGEWCSANQEDAPPERFNGAVVQQPVNLGLAQASRAQLLARDDPTLRTCEVPPRHTTSLTHGERRV